MDKYNEKIINAVKCCIQRGTANCGKCGYSCYKDCVGTMLSDLEYAIFKPSQKPLTLEEVLEISKREPCVYLEDNHFPTVEAARIEMVSFRNSYKHMCEIEIIGSEEYHYREPNDYGKTWRCWSMNPSDEEKDLVKWNE